MNNNELITFFKKKRNDFPILKEKVNNKKLIYFDNAATTQKPKQVIKAISNYYETYNSNVHRGLHTLSERATNEYEETRKKVAKLINANENEIVYTSGTTDSMNLAAFGLLDQIKRGDEIILSEAEHHANIVPWQQIAKKKGAKLKYVKLKKDFTLDITNLKKLLTNKTKIVSLAHISNTTGAINPIKEIAKLAHKKGAILVVDAAQSVPHMRVNVKDLDADILVFSAHKMCGPTGVGILYGKYELLEKMQPYRFGGSMIYNVELENSTFTKPPHKFEAGTPHIAGIIALGTTIDYLQKLGMKNIEKHEKILTKHFLKKIKEVEDLTLYGPTTEKNRAAVFSFNVEGIHSHDMSVLLDKHGIATRGGHHCAMPLTKVMDVNSTSRASLYFYNTTEEIDKLIKALKQAKKDFEQGKFL